MKLYATITTAEGKKEGLGSDNWIDITLTHKNTVVKRLVLELEKGTGGYNWALKELDSKVTKGNRSLTAWQDRIDKGNKQKDEGYVPLYKRPDFNK